MARTLIFCSRFMLIAAVILATAVMTDAQQAWAQGGSISGVVRDAGGLPVVGASVCAEFLDDGDEECAQTIADGSYIITDLTAGSYRVRARAEGYIREYYDGVRDYDDATPVSVIEGQARTGIDFALVLGGSICGVVTDAQDSPVEGAWVIADGADSQTGADGAYCIAGLTAGDYRVWAQAEGYTREYYNGVRDYDAATSVPVIEGQATTGIDFALDLGGFICGVITDAKDGPISGARVEADGQSSWGHAETGPDGAYCITGLTTGDYRVWAQAEGYIDEYYDGARVRDDATPVPVVEGETTTHIDFALDLGGSISGVVRDAGGLPIAGASVCAELLDDGDEECAQTIADGSYFVKGLVSGEYILHAAAPGYFRQFYNGVWEQENATPVTVMEGEPTTGIDFALDLGASISGSVTDEQGNPVEGAAVLVNLPGDVGIRRALEFTHADGSYQVVPWLAAGSYLVFVLHEGHALEYYDGARWQEDATLVNVVEGANTPGIDFSLDLAGTISGIVTDMVGDPVTGATVYVDPFDHGSPWWWNFLRGTMQWATANTRIDGSYRVDDLGTGSYSVRVEGEGYVSEYYDDVLNREDVTPVAVTDGNDTAGINFSLALLGPTATATPTIANTPTITSTPETTPFRRKTSTPTEEPTDTPVPAVPTSAGVPTLPPTPLATPLREALPIIAPLTGEGPSAGPGWTAVAILAGGIGAAMAGLALGLRRRHSG